jgi:enoyl-CoA hydratase/carnithine racemase/3-hydroxyacyl-CoA dehydrogenase
MKSLRQSTLETLGLGTVLDIFRRGTLPVSAGTLTDRVFGNSGARGALLISGANGIAGAGKTMQLGSRLTPFGITIVGLDIAGAPDGIGRQYQALKAAFGQSKADEIMSGIVRLNYDGRTLPAQLHGLHPRLLLEAIPEILAVKKAHYAMFRGAFPDIEIRSVTSGFPSAELGVGIAHPSFPHEVNKVWEIVERSRSDFTHLLWAIGLIPIPVSDHWSFVLDVLFCGLTLAALRYHRASNMPCWKIDKYVRRALGPNPFRAHDAIGARGANFLTWSCLQHLSEKYGSLFAPGEELEYRKTSGQGWYPPDHFRPVVNWSITAGEEEELLTWLLGPILQMTSLMLHEQRAHLSHINAIGELCAQFRRGILALIREMGPETAIKQVEAYHRLYPAAAGSCWHPDVFGLVEQPSWQQLYVNAEHDGSVGVITISRESYNSDIDAELNRAIDWLKSEKIAHVIVTSDFHLSTQMVGADTADFYSSLKDAARGTALSLAWSETARRLHYEFAVSVGVVAGKRCLGGMLELLMHCHYLIAREDSTFGMPEVTLPVIPGMEGCHWPLRKVRSRERQRVLRMLLTGESVRATEAAGWLVDFLGPVDRCLQKAWELATPGNRSLPARPLIENAIDIAFDTSLPPAQNAMTEAAREAVADCIRASCGASLAEALGVQARHSGAFMAGELCRSGVIGRDANRILAV